MEQSTENRTAQEWGSVIADLTRRGANADAEAVALAEAGDRLALDAELGISAAAEQLRKIRREQAAKLAASENLQIALASARRRHAEAQAREAAEGEKQRREQLSVASTKYLEQAAQVDEGMRELAARFAGLRVALDRLEALATAGERQPLQQLRSPFGATLAAAFHGLGDHIELGPRAGHIPQRQALSAYAESFVAGWISEPANRKEL